MLITAKSVLKFTLILVLGSLFLVYLFSQSERYIKGPSLSVNHPINGTSTTTQDIFISGSAQRVAFLSLNDMQIFATDEGFFQQKLLLSPGYNIIEVKVTDRFKREKIERLHITYVDQSGSEHIDLGSVSTTSPPSTEGDVPVSTSTLEIAEEEINNN